MRNEIASETAAITGLDRSRDRQAAKLAPCDRQDHRHIGAGAIPAPRHSAVRALSGAVLRSIRHQLVWMTMATPATLSMTSGPLIVKLRTAKALGLHVPPRACQ